MKRRRGRRVVHIHHALLDLCILGTMGALGHLVGLVEVVHPCLHQTAESEKANRQGSMQVSTTYVEIQSFRNYYLRGYVSTEQVTMFDALLLGCLQSPSFIYLEDHND